MCLFSGLLPFVCWFDVCIGSLFLLFVVCPLLLCRPLCAVLSRGLRIQYRIEFGAPRPQHLSKILLLPGVVKYKELKRGKRESACIAYSRFFFNKAINEGAKMISSTNESKPDSTRNKFGVTKLERTKM